MLFFLLLTIVAVANAECECYMGNCAFFSGTEYECYCWCNSETARLSAGGRCSFFPEAEFSSGGCSFCPSSSEAEELVISTTKGAVVKTVHSDTPGPFLVTASYCVNGEAEDGNCNPFLGEYAECKGDCDAWAVANVVKGHSWKFTYLPAGEFSSGGCAAQGPVDPCKYNPW